MKMRPSICLWRIWQRIKYNDGTRYNYGDHEINKENKEQDIYDSEHENSESAYKEPDKEHYRNTIQWTELLWGKTMVTGVKYIQQTL